MLEQRLHPRVQEQALLRGLLQLLQLGGQLPLLPLVVGLIAPKILPADQSFAVVLIGRLFQPVEPLQAPFPPRPVPWGSQSPPPPPTL